MRSTLYTEGARAKLEVLRGRIQYVMGDPCDMGVTSPLRAAVSEVTQKMAKKPSELEHSSKLYRAIDEIEMARACLSQVARELRDLTGWQPSD